jgi:hypothetical protein
MRTKKLVHGIIAALIFIALAIGANAASGFGVIVVVTAMALHAGQTVWLFGREWKGKDETDIPTGFIYHGGGSYPTYDDKPDEVKVDSVKELDYSSIQVAYEAGKINGKIEGYKRASDNITATIQQLQGLYMKKINGEESPIVEE